MSTHGFDDLIENAWREFAANVASRVPDLGRKEFLEIARQDGERYRVLLVFTRTGPGKVRCTLDGTGLPWGGRAGGVDAHSWSPGTARVAVSSQKGPAHRRIQPA
ncbi:hypothetical protein [Gordonia jacobaea]|uniref:hypothetical protein n=1 Tax=Gordonia jacobaea TaxID=122202 RepID=UPI003D7649FA